MKNEGGPPIPLNATLLVVTDSQSLIRKLESGPFHVKDSSEQVMWKAMSKWLSGPNNTRKIIFQHVFSHCGVDSNERADALATEAAEDDRIARAQAHVPVTYSNLVNVLNRAYCTKFFDDLELDVDSHHDHFFGKWKPGRSFTGLPRFKQALCSQLRCGECPLIGKYRMKVGPAGGDYRCRWCLGNGVETVGHVFASCTNARIRQLRNEFLKISAEEKKPDAAPNGMSNKSPLIALMLPHRANDVVEFVLAALDHIGVHDTYLQERKELYAAFMAVQ